MRGLYRRSGLQISEYILPSIPAVFIYCSNSQGFSMGALYNALQTHLDKWLKHAKQKAKKCIFDPKDVGISVSGLQKTFLMQLKEPKSNACQGRFSANVLHPVEYAAQQPENRK